MESRAPKLHLKRGRSWYLMVFRQHPTGGGGGGVAGGRRSVAGVLLAAGDPHVCLAGSGVRRRLGTEVTCIPPRHPADYGTPPTAPPHPHSLLLLTPSNASHSTTTPHPSTAPHSTHPSSSPTYCPSSPHHPQLLLTPPPPLTPPTAPASALPLATTPYHNNSVRSHLAASDPQPSASDHGRASLLHQQ